MANETLSIQKDDARLTVIGKSKADVYINSGLGLDLGDLDIGSLDPFDLNWQIDVPEQNNLPDEIRIITPPTKTEYRGGEKVDLSGAVVGAYKNGTIWTNSKYPNGHIPLGELIVSPLIVFPQETFEGKVSPYFDQPVVVSELINETRIKYKYGRQSYQIIEKMTGKTDTPVFATASIAEFPDDVPETFPPEFHYFYAFIVFASESPFRYTTDTSSIPWWSNAGSVTYEGKTVYWGLGGEYNWGAWVQYVLPDKEGFHNPYQTYPEAVAYDTNNQKGIAWTMIYGSEGPINKVDLSWVRPVDGEILSTSFQIDGTEERG